MNDTQAKLTKRERRFEKFFEGLMLDETDEDRARKATIDAKLEGIRERLDEDSIREDGECDLWANSQMKFKCQLTGCIKL